MSGKTAAELAAEQRRARSQEQLRANLKRRKDQMRARRAEAAAAQPADNGSPGGEAPDTGDESA